LAYIVIDVAFSEMLRAIVYEELYLGSEETENLLQLDSVSAARS
jgi:hypothetical protein